MMKAEVGVMWPRAKEYGQLLGAGTGKDSLPEPPEGAQPC